ncbi:DUF6884 domain-containing protein [Mesorhizobium sp.]|uniref:DUF6884 domain-containing protein n=1 Tax=Mesorhizobium sp. TaxID=1871066 RepID=UPI0025EA51C4|nr:DUF6884 domain-containing protein [Mesorhizobium sp.]
MSQADRIRNFVIEAYLEPSRKRGLDQIELRAGDIHRAMELKNAMPAVCSAIGSTKFEVQAGVKTIARTGPSNGSNARFRFSIGPGLQARREPPIPSANQPTCKPDVNFTGAVVLISCVKSKLSHEAAARDLYTSPLFTGPRGLAEGNRVRWYVLSALYGLVAPQSVIAPYDFTLNTRGVSERREWTDRVFRALILAEPDLRRVIMFAGHRYREFLTLKLLERGIHVDVPMEGLRQGEQLAWLAERS